MAAAVAEPAAANAQIVRELYRRTFARNPDQREFDTALAFVESQRTQPDDMTGWQRLAHALLAANEFVFLD